MRTFEERLKRLNEMIAEASNIVFFGGAGVSTESGIPDFRSKDGLYNQKDVNFDKYKPEYLLSDECLYYHPKVFYEFYRQKLDCRDIEPNVTHKVLAKLEDIGKVKAIVTQNIDGLHQKAGSKNVYEIHGTTMKNYCNKCYKSYPADYIFETSAEIPKCECGGVIRPEVTLYGECLPEKAWNEAEKAIRAADMLIVGGTSLTVYPAAGLVRYYEGDKLVIMNRDATEYDGWSDLQFHEGLGEIFKNIKFEEE